MSKTAYNTHIGTTTATLLKGNNMPKMREVNKTKNAAKAAKATANYTMTPVEMNGQVVMMKVLKPVSAPKGLTARC